MIETAILIAILIGISQVAKELGLKTKYIPLFNVVLGIVLGAFFIAELTMQERILQGLIIGLSASGLFDQSKLFKGEM
jgi:uncharacterized membrane protein HdeD (DUF308 family)